jgi:NADH-quinone oxidoreductase subunit H
MVEWITPWLKILIFPGFIFAILASLFYEWLDRKFYAKFQNRVGPLYTGPSGLLQPLADFIKLLSKEDITPEAADKPFFNLIPIFAVATVLTGILMLPIASEAGVVSFYGDAIVAVAILTIFCVLVFLAGLFSVNRFSFVGAERAVSQLIGYEIPLTIALIGVLLAARSIRISDVVGAQASWWFILGPQAIGFAVFLIAGQAELERIPFDIPEAEQEIVAGWLTEYSGRKLALLRLAGDLELFYISGLAATFYLGGPNGPMIPGLEPLLRPVYFIAKTILVLYILSAIRSLFARLRIDQMVSFSWKYLVPISLFQLLVVRILI